MTYSLFDFSACPFIVRVRGGYTITGRDDWYRVVLLLFLR